MMIEVLKRRTLPGAEPSLINPAWTAGMTAREGWEARISEDGGDGATYLLSRMDDDGQWRVDGQFRGSLPVFNNGFGSRLSGPAYAEWAEALEYERECLVENARLTGVTL